jgi:hypothetical protein
MTIFNQSKEHSLDCNCTYCCDVDPNKSVARELEKYIEELIKFSVTSLNEDQQKSVHQISEKILLLRRYFPTMELPSKHSQLLLSLKAD